MENASSVDVMKADRDSCWVTLPLRHAMHKPMENDSSVDVMKAVRDSCWVKLPLRLATHEPLESNILDR